MDDNIWEYPFGELDEDDDMFYRKPGSKGSHQRQSRDEPGSSRAHP